MLGLYKEKREDYKTISFYLNTNLVDKLDDYAKDRCILSRSSALNILLAEIFNAELANKKD